MRRRRRVLVMLAAALTAAGSAGCAQNDDVDRSRRDGAGTALRTLVASDRRATLRAEAGDGASLIRVLGCGGCHTGVPAPERPIASGLMVSDPAMDQALAFAYLRDSPRAASTGEAHSPAFHLDDAEALALSLHLAGGSRHGGSAQDRFDAALRRYGEVDAETGSRVFRALNCAACHEHVGVEPRKNGPPLVGVASRLRPVALREFLRRPNAVRPFGFEPGGGGRMPDFVLRDAEVDSIVAYLGTLPVRFAALESSARGPLSAFGAAKARALLTNKLSCVGCHAMNGEGGRVGPDLARAGERLDPAYIAAIITDPQHTMPGTVMPPAMLPPATRDLIIAFLTRGGLAADRDGGREAGGAADVSADTPEIERGGYLSLVDHPLTHPALLHADVADEASVAVTDPAASRTPPSQTPPVGGRSSSLYAARCAMCHGAEGRGDGYNARYLRTPAAVHASADPMRRRPDDTLFDGIYAGGAILGGSPEMPAFGESLSASQIAGLVAYIRELCDCVQPGWAEDGGR